MAQYSIVEERNLPSLPWAEKAKRLGFLDFLRALRNDPPALPSDDFIRIEGIEEVLLASRPKMEEMAYQIHHSLQEAANALNRLNTQVAVVVRGEIVPGAQLRVQHVTAPIPLHLIFGSPPATDAGGRPVYQVSFNLSSDR